MPPSARSNLSSIDENEKLVQSLETLDLSELPTSAKKVRSDKQRSQTTPEQGSGRALSIESEHKRQKSKTGVSRKERPTIKKSRSRQSCSSFAAQSASLDLTAQGTLISWLIERTVVRIAHHKYKESKQFPEARASINEMLRLYDEITAFPDVDMASMAACEVPPQLESWRNTLKMEYQSALAESKNSAGLDVQLHPLLRSRVHVILHVSSYTSHLKTAAQGRAVYEAEYRRGWDGLLYSCTVTDSNIAVSPGILLERMLNLPRNESRDAVETDQSLLERYRAIATLNGLLWTDAVAKFHRDRKALGASEVQKAADEADQVRETLYKLDEDAIKRAVKEHSANEPLQARADAMFVVPIDLPGLTNLATKPNELKSLVHKVALIRYSAPIAEDLSPSTTKSTLAFSKSSQGSGGVALGQDRHDSDQLNAEYHLRFPIFVAEYKKFGKTFDQAFNQARIYCVAVIIFMRELGIHDCPVFGLVTSGSKGWLIMAWNKKLDKRDQGFLLDTNVMTFDISIPVQCFHFAAILLRLAKHGHDITRQFDVGDLEARFFAVGQGQVRAWTKEAQAEEYGESNVDPQIGGLEAAGTPAEPDAEGGLD